MTVNNSFSKGNDSAESIVVNNGSSKLGSITLVYNSWYALQTFTLYSTNSLFVKEIVNIYSSLVSLTSSKKYSSLVDLRIIHVLL